MATQHSIVGSASLPDAELRVRRAYHELRSPTALIITVARHALEEHDLDRALSALALIERIADRTLGRVSTALEAPATPSFRRPVDFLRQLSSDSARYGVRLELRVDGEAGNDEVRHEPAAFESLVQTLVENAQLHGDPSRPIALHVQCVPGELSLTVSNHCAEDDSHLGQQIGRPLAIDLADRMGGALRSNLEAGVYQVHLTVPTA